MQRGIRFLRDLSPEPGYFDWRVWNKISTRLSELFLECEKKKWPREDAVWFWCVHAHEPFVGRVPSPCPFILQICSTAAYPQASSLCPYQSLNIQSYHTISYPTLPQRLRTAFSTAYLCCANRHVFALSDASWALQSGYGPLHTNKQTIINCERLFQGHQIMEKFKDSKPRLSSL